MHAVNGVHVKKDGDAVGVKSHENDDGKLKEAISNASFPDEIDIGEAGAGEVYLSEWVVTGGMEGGGHEGGREGRRSTGRDRSRHRGRRRKKRWG
jgi:hypothetical protein